MDVIAQLVLMVSHIQDPTVFPERCVDRSKLKHMVKRVIPPFASRTNILANIHPITLIVEHQQKIKTLMVILDHLDELGDLRIDGAPLEPVLLLVNFLHVRERLDNEIILDEILRPGRVISNHCQSYYRQPKP